MKYLILCLSMLLYLLPGSSQELLLKNARVIDVKKGHVSSPTDVLIRDGKIHRIGPHVGKQCHGAVEDLQGAYLLPGLINAHVHIANDPGEKRVDRIHLLEYLLRHGITTVRDAAGDARILKDLQQGVQQGEIAGPDIYYAAFVAGPAYYKDNDREKNMVAGLDTAFAPWLQCIRPGDDLHAAMQAAKDCGACGIKIYGGFNREELFPLVQSARKAGLRIWGHAALFPAKPLDVAEAGVEVLSHVYLLEWEGVKEKLSDDFFRNHELYYEHIDHEHLDICAFVAAMKKKKAIFDPTLFLCLENHMAWSAPLVKQLYLAGVEICAGTDWIEDCKRSWPFLLDEISLYVEQCGFTPLDAIRSATIVAAKVIGAEDMKGSIERGKQADLLILNGNPLENIENLKDIRMVVKDGVIVD